jgi:sorbose reductase
LCRSVVGFSETFENQTKEQPLIKHSFVNTPTFIMVLHKPAGSPVLQQFSLKGKVAAITGGCRGIGLEISRALAEAGCNVAIIYNTTKDTDANAIASKISNENGVQAKAYKSNVVDKALITTTLNQISEDFGKLDIVVANSGITSEVPAEEYSLEQWREVMRVNLDGAFYTAQAAANIFKKQSMPGNIIFTASTSATTSGYPQHESAYDASKAGVVQLAKSLAVEWIDICRVNCVSPGYIATDSGLFPLAQDIWLTSLVVENVPEEWNKQWMKMIPAGRMGDPEELKGVGTASPILLNLTIPGICLSCKQCEQLYGS